MRITRTQLYSALAGRRPSSAQPASPVRRPPTPRPRRYRCTCRPIQNDASYISSITTADSEDTTSADETDKLASPPRSTPTRPALLHSPRLAVS
ncbi:MAG: hypothetical protein R2705_15325 [Ilumatobacteraceae bacterium]